MNELLKEKFFNLLIEPSQATNEEIQNAIQIQQWKKD